MFYGYQSSIIHAFVDINLDIHEFSLISMRGLAIDSCSREETPFGIYYFNTSALKKNNVVS